MCLFGITRKTRIICFNWLKVVRLLTTTGVIGHHSCGEIFASGERLK